MQDTMIYEQEQLLMAIDDIDDAQIMAEAAVISKMADLYLRQALIQESMTEEQFEAYFQEANKEDAQDDEPSKFAQFKDKFKDKAKGKFTEMGEKIKNFDVKELLKKILTVLKNVFSAICSGLVKFIRHLDPRWWAQLYRVKSSEIAHIAKKEGIKLKVNDDRSVTCMFLLPDFTIAEKWCDAVERYLDGLQKAMQNYRDGNARTSFGKLRCPNISKRQTGEKDANGHMQYKWPMKWTSIDEFVKVTNTGEDRMKLNGETNRIESVLKKFTAISGANGKFNAVISALNSLPADVFNEKSEDGTVTDKVKKGYGKQRTELGNICKEKIAELNKLLDDAKELRSDINSAFMKANNKAENLRNQLSNPDRSELWSKTKTSQGLEAAKQKYDEDMAAAKKLRGQARQDAIDAAEDAWAAAQNKAEAGTKRDRKNEAVRRAINPKI